MIFSKVAARHAKIQARSSRRAVVWRDFGQPEDLLAPFFPLRPLGPLVWLLPLFPLLPLWRRLFKYVEVEGMCIHDFPSAACKGTEWGHSYVDQKYHRRCMSTIPALNTSRSVSHWLSPLMLVQWYRNNAHCADEVTCKPYNFYKLAIERQSFRIRRTRTFAQALSILALGCSKHRHGCAGP